MKQSPGPHPLADEPVFILMARDPVAPAIIRAWARRRFEVAKEDEALAYDALGAVYDTAGTEAEQLSRACDMANTMEAWRKKCVDDAKGGLPRWRRQGHLFEPAASEGFTRLAAFGGFLRALMDFVGEANQRWWVDPRTGEPIERNVGEILMLIVSECSEGMEGHRRGLQDTHLPQYPMFTVELADAVIRILDAASHLAPDFPEAFVDKMTYNAQRLDHTHAARLEEGGKKY